MDGDPFKLNGVSSQYADGAPGYVFISYIREDRERVDRLQASLERAGIRVWRDTDDLRPGQDWRIEIHRAITAGSLAFVACFSENTERRATTYQNEELILAVEQMRRRPPSQVWLIPVRFAECTTPHYDLGAGRNLDSLHRIDLFDGSWEHGIPRLVAAVLRVLPAPRPEKRQAATEAAEHPAPALPRNALLRNQVIPGQPWPAGRRIARPTVSRRRVSGSAVFRIQLLTFAAAAIGPFLPIRISAGVAALVAAVFGVNTSSREWPRERLTALMRGLNSIGLIGTLLILIIGASIDYAVSPVATSPGALRNFEWAEGAWVLAWALGNVICAVHAFVRASMRRGRALSLIQGTTTALTAIGLAAAFQALVIDSYTLLTLAGSAFLAAFLITLLSLTKWVISPAAAPAGS